MPVTGNNRVPESEEQEILSIRLSTDGFSFYIYSPRREAYTLTLEREVNEAISLTANLKHLYQELELLQRSYKRVNVVVAGQRHTYVPKELMERECAELIFRYNQQHIENEEVVVNPLKNSSAAVLFGIDKSTFSFVHDRFGQAEFYSQSGLLCDYFCQKSRGGNDHKMYVWLRKEGIDLFVFENGNLLMENSFETERDSDNIYYILAAWKQLGMDQEMDELHLHGAHDKVKAIEKELKRYIKRVDMSNTESDIDIQELNIDYANN